MENKSDKFVSIAYFQLIAAFFIALRHYSFFLDLSPAKSYFERVNFVEFFFCCSGFFIYRSCASRSFVFVDFITRRLSKIYPAHFLTTIFFVLIVIAREFGAYKSIGNNAYDLSDVFPVITLLHSTGLSERNVFNYPSWYLSAQFFLYLAFVPILYLIKKVRMAVFIIVFVIVISLALLEYYSIIFGTHWTDWTFKFGIFRGVPSFLCGIVLSYFAMNKKANENGWFFSSILIFLCFFMFCINGMDFFTYFVFQVLLLWAFVFFGNKFLDVLPKTIFRVDVSELSFGVYIFHVPVASVVLSFFYRHFFENDTSRYLVWFFIGVSLVISLIVSVFWSKLSPRFLSFVKSKILISRF